MLGRVRQAFRTVRRPSGAARGRQSYLGEYPIKVRLPDADATADPDRGESASVDPVADGLRFHLQQLRDLLNREECFLRQTAPTESKWGEAGLLNRRFGALPDPAFTRPGSRAEVVEASAPVPGGLMAWSVQRSQRRDGVDPQRSTATGPRRRDGSNRSPARPRLLSGQDLCVASRVRFLSLIRRVVSRGPRPHTKHFGCDRRATRTAPRAPRREAAHDTAPRWRTRRGGRSAS